MFFKVMKFGIFSRLHIGVDICVMSRINNAAACKRSLPFNVLQ